MWSEYEAERVVAGRVHMRVDGLAIDEEFAGRSLPLNSIQRKSAPARLTIA